MRYSQSFIPTVKEVPKDATMPSHVLLLRGGYIRMVGAGIYELLPLGTAVLRNIERIIREELAASGVEEVVMPTLLPAEYFKETGRWELYGSTLFRLNDRKSGEYHLAPTHEEIVTDLMRREVRSYKQLPRSVFQIQWKYRDEPRPRAGLLRGREFLMKDAYSFDATEEGALRSYATFGEAYQRIFHRLGLNFRMVQADSGAIGGSKSAEFQILTQTGEDRIVACTTCEYAANIEVAEVRAATAPTLTRRTTREQTLELDKVSTPNAKSIDDVLRFFGNSIEARDTIKSLIFIADDEPVLAVVRGDHEVNEIKLLRALGAKEIRLANDAEAKHASGTQPGSIGPVGFKGRILADHDASAVVNAVGGANESNFHYRNINFGRDYEAELASIRDAMDGDACPQCGAALGTYRGIEGGHIFVLGTHYSEKMNATFLDESGNAKPFVMGCYGIGVTRLIAAVIEQHHDESGIRWPASIAPYPVHITVLGKDEEPLRWAAELHDTLQSRGHAVLLDDRDERPGVKFKDADLLGMPIRVTVGGRAWGEHVVEVKLRTEAESQRVPVADAIDYLRDKLLAMGV